MLSRKLNSIRNLVSTSLLLSISNLIHFSVAPQLVAGYPRISRNFSTGKDHSQPPSEDDIVHLDDRADIRIPEYKARDNEPIGVQRQRLVYQSRKRGMLENDLLLSTFADKYLKSMNVEQLNMYDQLINKPSNDWDIYYWATGNKEIPPEHNNEIMKLFCKHVRNEAKEARVRMPDLN